MIIPLPYRGPNACAESLSDMDLDLYTRIAGSILAGKCNNTPIPGMWKGYLFTLVIHSQCLLLEATLRQRRVSKVDADGITNFVWLAQQQDNKEKPPWMGDPWMHRSHRSRLLGRNLEHYEPQFPGNPLKMPLLWPVLDDSLSQGYRLTITRSDAALIDKRAYRLPEGLRLKSNLEVVEA